MKPALLLGRDCTAKGIIETAEVGPWGLALSRGLDSPAPKHDPNEDACGVVSSATLSVAVVADAHFGRMSAEVAVQSMLSEAIQKPPTIPDTEGWLRRALGDAHRRAQPGSSACALLAVVLQGGQLFWISMGDCRLYRVRQGATEVLNPMTSRYLGDWGMLTPESGKTTLQPGDRIIMASDGLPECRYGIPTLTPMTLGLIAETGTAKEAALALTEAAISGGGEDNIAVVVFA